MRGIRRLIVRSFARRKYKTRGNNMNNSSKDRQFEQLIEKELPKLRGLAFRILRNAADTDDAIQDALFKAYNRFDSFRSQAELSSWVCRITINCSLDILRKRKREQEGLSDYHPETVSQDTSPIWDAITDLPEPYSQAIIIGCLSGYDGTEAAKILGITTNALYQRVFKAKQMLKNSLSMEKAQ